MIFEKVANMKTNIGLALLRVGLGFGMLTHGVQKWQYFDAISQQFPNYLGLGADVNLALVVFAELFCAVFVMFGVFTRLAALPLVITMLVAFFVAHGGDPFAKKEMAFLYLTGFTSLIFLGGGNCVITQKFPREKLPKWLGFWLA